MVRVGLLTACLATKLGDSARHDRMRCHASLASFVLYSLSLA